MQALEPARVGAAADPELERRAAVAADFAGGELAADPPLLGRRALEVGGELRVALDRVAPALDPAGRLQPRDGGDEVRAGEVVRRRERVAGVVVRPLLGDRGRAAGQRAATRRKARGGRPSCRSTSARSSIAADRSPAFCRAFRRRHSSTPLTMKIRSPGRTRRIRRASRERGDRRRVGEPRLQPRSARRAAARPRPRARSAPTASRGSSRAAGSRGRRRSGRRRGCTSAAAASAASATGRARLRRRFGGRFAAGSSGHAGTIPRPRARSS